MNARVQPRAPDTQTPGFPFRAGMSGRSCFGMTASKTVPFSGTAGRNACRPGHCATEGSGVITVRIRETMLRCQIPEVSVAILVDAMQGHP